MAIFRYKAKNSKGRTKNGLDVAMSEADLLQRLRRQNLDVVSLVLADNSLEAKLNLLLNRVSGKDLAIFSRQFAVMISANVPVVESLVILIEQTSNFKLKQVVAEVAFEVTAGGLLSDSLMRHPKIFDNFFVNMVKSGEASGKLDEVLEYLADQTEKSYDTASKVKGAMIYPVFVSVAMVVVGVILMVKILPSLTGMLEESGTELPMTTKIIIAASDFLTQYLWLLIVLLIGVVFLIRLYLKTDKGRRNWDSLSLRLPIFGKLVNYIVLTRFTRSLSTLLKGGVTITKSLEVVSGVVSNKVYEDILLRTLQSIQDGNSLSTVMNTEAIVPKMIPQMIAVGERTGKLDVVLDSVTGFYTRESDKMLSNLSSLMEPLIMVIMGIGVGIMVAAVIMPMYNMATQF
ncbi:MAG: type II secretion system F family protein [Patescibacteria group bacterium]|jgi:type IV pilus assembly protein PilC|nr:type II secretion system F family protein [Patescibacteria group bacterium]MDD3435409.1 type II secretion system F family protein [Patescibacteria group bacterium]